MKEEINWSDVLDLYIDKNHFTKYMRHPNQDKVNVWAADGPAMVIVNKLTGFSRQ